MSTDDASLRTAAESAFDCSLLVASCDRYYDLWTPFFSLLRAHWPDCPFGVVLITEAKQPIIPGVQPLCLGSGHDWSTLLIRALGRVRTKYVLLTLEDFFLRCPVDNARILKLFRLMQQQDLSMLRLIPRPGPSGPPVKSLEYGDIDKGSPYRVSTQAAFWRVDTLRGLLLPGESAWEFEVNGTKRSATLDGFAALWHAALPYRHHVVERGKWFPWAAWTFGRLDIGVDLVARPVMTMPETVSWLIGKAAHPIVQRIPLKLRRLLRRR